ncbi:MAG TPA: patatin-like phospholipase family protein [Solirubrobacteraceae bacterium]|nr:patatin-like phospholipase family protein [Solirubrobacteraceae bacterium]
MAGVLEGGGAKGAAYAGALDALCEQRAWFVSVCGSSAGALTAAMVAAGLRPAEIREHTIAALRLVSVPRIAEAGSVIRRLRGGGGDPPHVRDSADLVAYVERVLRAQVGDRTSGPDGPVTFTELHEATGIELFLVAVDARGRRERVFHHHLTPGASVAAAAVWSAAIPFYFPPGIEGPTGEERILLDGGVWSNFPAWVYTDASFRAAHPTLDAVAPTQDGSPETPYVIGLLLDENQGVSKEDAPPSRPIRRAGGLGTTLLSSIWMLTQPFYLLAVALFVVVMSLLNGCVVLGLGGACTASGWIHALGDEELVIGLLLVLWLFTVSRTVLRPPPSRLFLPGPIRAVQLWAGAMSFVLLLLTYRLALLEPEPAYADVLADDGWEVGVWIVLALTMGLTYVVGTLALGIVGILGPAIYGLGRWLAPAFAGAGSARYWVGSAPGDRVIRIPVRPYSTLDFAAVERDIDAITQRSKDVATAAWLGWFGPSSPGAQGG